MIFAETERLILRRPRVADAEFFLRNWDDPEMTRYTDRRPNPARFIADLVEEMQTKAPGDLEPQPWYQFAIERAADGAVVGDIGVGFGIPGERQAELGYRIHLDHQRQGYAREAVAGIITYLIVEHAIHRFVAVVASQNVASAAVLRRLGFRQEGHFRQSFLCGGKWLDDDYFALLATEWRGTSENP